MESLESRRRRTHWFLIASCIVMLAAFMPFSRATAQDEAKTDDAGAAATASTGTEGGSPAEEPPLTLLQLIIKASGLIGLMLLIVSIYFVATVINLFMNMTVKSSVPDPLVEKLEAAVKEKRFQDVYDTCKDDPCYLARLVKTGVANLPNGKEEAKEAMEGVSIEVVTEMETKISYLAVIGTLGPMIGLVGTIMGMINSFRVLASAVNAQPKPNKVAEGIMEALFLTLEGIALSVPAIFFYALFRNRIARISIEANKAADRIIKNILAAAKAKTA